VHDRVLSRPQWEERCDEMLGRARCESTWPALRLAVVVEAGGTAAWDAAHVALEKLHIASKLLLAGNASGMRLANARIRDLQLSREIPSGCVVRVCMCGRFTAGAPPA